MKKIFSVMMLLAVLIFSLQVQAADVFVGNEENGDKVYLMTETVKKEKLNYSSDWKRWSYQYYMTFKSVNSRYGSFYFGYTITRDFDEPPMYQDQNEKWQPIDLEGDEYFNDDPNIYRANILHNAYRYLLENGYL